MKDYSIAVAFEKAGNVRRLLEYVGRSPSKQDDLFIHELQVKLDNTKGARILESWEYELSAWQSV